MTDVDWRGYRILAWMIVGVLAVLAVIATVRQGWQNGVVLGGFTLATALYLRFAGGAPAAFNAVLAASVAMNAGGWAWGIFDTVWGYDEVAHALGTLGMTLPIGWYGYRSIAGALRRHGWAMLLAVAALGIALGALWEMAEWLGYWYFTQPSVQQLNDKISDLAADSLGAIIAAAFFRWALIQREEPAAPARASTEGA